MKINEDREFYQPNASCATCKELNVAEANTNWNRSVQMVERTAFSQAPSPVTTLSKLCYPYTAKSFSFDTHKTKNPGAKT